MNVSKITSPFSNLLARLNSAEHALSQKANVLTFLVIRFVLMSAMVVGFSWYAFGLHP